jgi:hypothetical protein
MPIRPPDAPCLDSSQTWFCRDLWIHQAKEGVRESDGPDVAPAKSKRAELVEEAVIKEAIKKEEVIKKEAIKKEEVIKKEVIKKEEPVHEAKDDIPERRQNQDDADANVGSDYDAMPDSDDNLGDAPSRKLSIPNSVFRAARILVNPRCVTTYAGVSHTQLAMDLFGPERDEESDLPKGKRGKYVLDDWEGAPESFVCQEQKYFVPFPPSIFCLLIEVTTIDRQEGEKQRKRNDDLASRYTRKLNASLEYILQ